MALDKLLMPGWLTQGKNSKTFMGSVTKTTKDGTNGRTTLSCMHFYEYVALVTIFT